jgi:hypothetical protein
MDFESHTICQMDTQVVGGFQAAIPGAYLINPERGTVDELDDHAPSGVEGALTIRQIQRESLPL